MVNCIGVSNVDEKRADECIEQITKLIEEIADTGCPVVGYFNVVPVEDRQSKTWSIYSGSEIEDLFAIPDYKVAQILSVLGSEVRLAILRELIRKPLTAAELVDILKMKTTGQAYHHLKDLQSAGYVEQRSGGRFHINMRVARVYVAALGLASDAGARIPNKPSQRNEEEHD